MANLYRGKSGQAEGSKSLRVEPIITLDYTYYDTGSGTGLIETAEYWVLTDTSTLSSQSLVYNKNTDTYEASSSVYIQPLNYTGSFYGDFYGTASYATQALSASWAPGSSAISTGSFYVSSPAPSLFVQTYLILYRGDGTPDAIDLSTLSVATASFIDGGTF